jgi:MFS family permease
LPSGGEVVKIISSFSALFLATFCFLMGNGLLSTFLSLRMTLEGFSTQITGLILAFYFIGWLTGSFACHYVIERVGHIRSFIAFVALATVCVMVYGLHTSAVGWAVLRLFNGIAAFGLFMVIESWLNELTDSHFRGRVFSIYMVITYLGVGFGQQMLKFGAIRSQDLFFVVGVLFALSMIPVAVTRAAHPELPKGERYRFAPLFRKAPISILGCMASGMMNSAFYAMVPVFSTQIGLTVSQVSWLMTVAVFGGLALQWVVGTLSDRYDRTVVISLLGASVALVTILVYIMETHSFLLLLVAMGSFGGLAFTIYPVAVARAQDVFEGKDAVPVSAGLLLAYSIGASIGPVAASGLMGLMTSPYGLFVYWPLIGSIFTVIALYLRQWEKIKIVPASEQVAFIPMKNTSPVAMEFDPRNEPQEDILRK